MTLDRLDVYTVETDDLLWALPRLMLAWDGQWFLKVHDELDWETAVCLNARVRAAFGRIEMRMMLKALGKRYADDVPDAVRVIRTYVGQVFAAGFEGDFRATEARMETYVTECAAWEGAKRAALERTNQACIACEGLWRAWFRTLLPNRSIGVNIHESMGDGDAQCHIVVEVERF